MTSPASDPASDRAQTAARMRALTAELCAAGLVAHLRATRGVLDITATLDRPGSRDISVTVDEDGHTTISYWAPGAAPAQAAAVIRRALAVITTRPMTVPG